MRWLGAEVLTSVRKNGGYTLLELIIVILILALIISIAAPKVVGYLGRSKIHAAEIQIANIGSALSLYRLDIGKYPTEEQGLKVLVEKPADTSSWDGPYLTRRDGIIDPWGQPYLYKIASSDGHPIIMSYGADGKAGGTGENCDVTSEH
ncbi:type II secretion system major pseudopilin GspG [Rhizomicrobium electricum]|uniref:Type II secretion system core protein G n=1 Tax=Rhizomicrobium electricum TaxID=480070 RepID=A0ABP3PMJ2_9PROT|nr:type II secretion system major pseudopilin GspG [Rhizomicrobium electricum]NIJ48761.1 general secretion pathway protein G [Rhizomicrobium electricum]